MININEPACDIHKNYYDINVRHSKENKKYDDFYHSIEWTSMRNCILGDYDGLDVYALYAHDTILNASLVHHIVELKVNWELRLSKINLIPISDTSHREIGKLYRIDIKGIQAMLYKCLERYKSDFKAHM
ncbi:MAG: hypothetical protein A2Y15_08665 [Clostridiales bacterium GWF2_36_10]|nr:MAG: hypothetical protein A2Y15_08665 [Clostridiales bacterium GWF2_36_10]